MRVKRFAGAVLGSLLAAGSASSPHARGQEASSIKAGYRTTIGSMVRIASAMAMRKLDFGTVPKVATMGELKKTLDGAYTGDCPLRDEWGNEFLYLAAPDASSYRLASAGSDGRFGGFDQKGAWAGFSGEDVILSDAAPFWVFAPKDSEVPLPDVSGEGPLGEYGTRLTAKPGEGIARRPASADFSAIHPGGKLGVLPSYDPASNKPFQVDLRSTDLSSATVADRAADLAFASFDSKTRWPELPKEFVPAAIMASGKNPGLGVRALHRRGITGRGIAIAIADQPLLVDHVEYAGRLKSYEEIHAPAEPAAMHGPAVASIAAGSTVGVAPEADLYFIAETHGEFRKSGFDWDFTHLARSIDRFLEINATLPAGKRIRVIALAIGWGPGSKGCAETNAAVERAKAAGVFVVSSSLSACYPGLAFHGLGRDPRTDPDVPASYGPGLWWAKGFFEKGSLPAPTLLIPMDSRCVASPTGPEDYVFYREGGWSWSIPWIAGLYALACQVRPDVTPELFWKTALATGDTVPVSAAGKTASLGTVVNPVRLIDALTSAGR